jgi:hypothetical protein
LCDYEAAGYELSRAVLGTAVRVAPHDDYRRLAQSFCDMREATGKEEVPFEDLSLRERNGGLGGRVVNEVVALELLAGRIASPKLE